MRKLNKLPRQVSTVSYSLEYGKEYLEMQIDAFKPKEKVIIIDDLIASGGTIEACRKLIALQKAEAVGAVVLIDINLKSKRVDPSLKVLSII